MTEEDPIQLWLYAFTDDNTSHEEIFTDFQQRIIPEARFLSNVSVNQEPYESKQIGLKIKCDAFPSEDRRLTKEDIACLISKHKLLKPVYITFREDYLYDFNSYAELQLQDFTIGSFDLASLKFNQYFSYSASFNYERRLIAEFDHARLRIQFCISDAYEVQEHGGIQSEVYELRLPFCDSDTRYIEKIFIKETPESADVYIVLTAPLQLWRTSNSVFTLLDINENTSWQKTARFKSHKRVDLHNFLGGSRSLKLVFANSSDYRAFKRSLVMNDFVLNYASVKSTPGNIKRLPFRQSLNHFGCDWYLQALHSFNYQTRSQFNTEFKDFITNSFRQDKQLLLHALERAYVTITKSQHCPLLKTVQYYLKNQSEKDKSKVKYSRYIWRVVVTPTRQYFQPMCLVHENRVIRDYDPEFMIAVDFRNDDFTRLNDKYSSREFIYDTISSTLGKGIPIANRDYRYLGSSNSQLRNHSFWFYAKDGSGNTADGIRGRLGDLAEERIPGRYIARIGQCFSRTMPVDLDQFDDLELRMDEPDVTRNGYCFTDGVGRISMDMLREVLSRLEMFFGTNSSRHPGSIPSAFQLRLAGCKGVLALDPTLEGKQILCRRSMNKFECASRSLEVVRFAKPTRLYLNKQIITLMDHHLGDFDNLDERTGDQCGIVGGSREFSRLLLTMVYDLADTLTDERKAALDLGGRSRFPCPYVGLVDCGFSLLRDPFFALMSRAAAQDRIDMVSEKFRVEVPVHEARNLLGVVDETASLEYGQVFVRYSADMDVQGASPAVVTGKVLVSKMPALHPGDVRVFEAVDIPKLHHHLDCIVFPQKGPRPHPDEMSGSDLDGDEYFVTWRPELLLKYENCTPMDYSPAKASNSNCENEPVTTEALIKYIVDYISGKHIGPIANSHCAWADQNGIYSPECLQFCQLHSDLIDSIKTGSLVEDTLDRPSEYPDFMRKMNHRKTYQSDRVLGRYYRIIKRVKVILSEKMENLRVTVDPRFVVQGHEEFLDSARELRRLYEESLSYLLQEYGIAHEIGAVSGCALTMNSPLAVSENDNYYTKCLVEGRFESLRERIRRLFHEEFDSRNDIAKKELAMRKASACYRIVYEEPTKFLSFAWLFADYLVDVLQKRKTVIPKTDRLYESIQAIPVEEVDTYLLEYKDLSELTPDVRKLYFILIRWLSKIGLSSHIANFLPLITRAMDEGSRTLTGVLKYIGLADFETRDQIEETLTKEVASAILCLTLYKEWKTILIRWPPSHRISETMRIDHDSWQKVLSLLTFNEHGRMTIEGYGDCVMKVRNAGQARFLHVVGPALQVFDVMDILSNVRKSDESPEI